MKTTTNSSKAPKAGDSDTGLKTPGLDLPRPTGAAGAAALKALLTNRSPLDALRALHLELGDVFQLSLGAFNPVVMAGPEACHFVLVEARQSLRWRPSQDPVARLLRQGLLMTDGQQHDDLRRRQFPSLHKRRVEQYLPTFIHATDQIVAGWPSGQPVDMLLEMRRLALIILCRSLFGYDPSRDLANLVPAIIKVIEYISPGVWLLADWVPRPGYQSAIEELDDFLYGLIRQRRERPGGQDLLSALINHADMDDDLIRDQLITMLIAGHDTSTAHLAWTLYLLSDHPHALNQVVEEIDEHLAGQPPTLQGLAQLGFLDRVLKESLRLYPPIHIGNRIVAEDLNFAGYRIPQGARLVYSIYLTHRHPSYWTHPDEFDPGRFQPGRSSARPAYAYLPFGGGPRNCIGTSFAQLEAKAVIARLLQRVSLGEVVHPVHKHMGATLEPKPALRMAVEARL